MLFLDRCGQVFGANVAPFAQYLAQFLFLRSRPSTSDARRGLNPACCGIAATLRSVRRKYPKNRAYRTLSSSKMEASVSVITPLRTSN